MIKTAEDSGRGDVTATGATAAPASAPPLKPSAPETDFRDLAEQIKELLLELIPEAGALVVWTDISGAKHEAPLILSARRQFLLMTRVDRMGPELIARLRRGANGSNNELMLTLIRSLADPEIAALFCELFELIHPNAVRKALTSGVIPDVDPEQPEKIGPFELFPLAEVARAVVPFLLGPIRELIASLAPAFDRMMAPETSH